MKTTTLIITFFYCFTGLAQAPTIEWQRVLGSAKTDGLDVILPTSDGGYLIGSNNSGNATEDKTEDSRGGIDYWLLKLDANGVNEWDKTLGGDSSDIMQQIVETSDGGFVIGGYSFSSMSGDKTEPSQGGGDFWVVKVDSSGNLVWQNTIGGDQTDILRSIILTDDGGFLVGGYSRSDISGDKTDANIGSDDMWVLKLNASGTIVWQSTIGGDNIDSIRDIKQTSDGGYILAGISLSGISGDKTEVNLGAFDYWVVRIDASGNVLWDKTIGGNDTDLLFGIAIADDGNFILAGDSESDMSAQKSEDAIGEFDYWIVKLSADGSTIIWENTIGGLDQDFMDGISKMPSGGFLVAGSSSSTVSTDKTQPVVDSNDIWAVRLDEAGQILWDKVVGSERNNDEPSVFIPTPDGGFIAGAQGYNTIFGDKTVPGYDAFFDGWLVKLGPESLGLEEQVAANISVYPNPIDQYLNVRLGKSYREINITINDLTGRRVFETVIFNQDQITEALELPSGIYILNMTLNGQSSVTKKIMKR